MPLSTNNISIPDGGAGGPTTANLVTCDTTNFNNNLSAADVNVQLALETLDDMVAGGAVEVQDEGVVVVPAAQVINFIGADVLAVQNGGNPNQVDVYIPAITFQPFYNQSNPSGNAVVPNIPTSNRNIADPAPANNFDIGSWVPGSVHPASNDGTTGYAHADPCSFIDLTTTVEVTVYDADDVTPLANYITPAITGNIVLPSGAITVTISNWAPDSTQWQANIDVDLNLPLLIANGGRYSVEIVHHNAGTDYTKTQGPLFYDAEAFAAVLAGVTIAETPGFVVTRFISGVEYYDTGSDFTIDIADIDYTNSDSYIAADLIECNGVEYGLPTLTPGSVDLTGWAGAWDVNNMTYNNTVWEITAVNFFTATTTANVSSRTLDWINGAWVNSANASILIDTHTDVSTRLIERFYDEQWRCPVTGNFDLPGQRSWDSTIDVLATDAVFYNGGCERNVTDFTIYDPNAASQPDYSGAFMDPIVYLYREFMHDGAASSGFTLNIAGTYTSLEMKLAAAWDGTPGGGTVWVDMLAAYNAAQWNNGNPLAGTGSWTGAAHYTFGSNNIVNTGDTLYLRIGFSAGERITALSVTFD